VHATIQLRLAALAILAAAPAAHAERLYALVRAPLVGDSLVTFDSSLPLLTSLPVRITGMRSGEHLLGIDFRPRDGNIYGISDTNRFYRIDPTSGSAQQVSPNGALLDPAPDGAEFGLDFNPRIDLFRSVSDSGQSLRVSPFDGLVFAQDASLRFAPGDDNEGRTPEIVDAAYTNSFVYAPATMLYDVDAALDILVLQSPANSGLLNTIGPLGVNIGGPTGFDISPDGPAYLSVRPIPALPLSILYSVNLTTGAATSLGTIGVNSVQDIAVELFCPADFNHDRQSDFFDYLDFAQALTNEDPAADFNRSGQVDFFDYLDFVMVFDQGC
jgi:hypothetical protein